ncbi:coiled-coil domain-containing protein 68-like [Scleropages formosus]|uniref:coiled-coil domain-containing protein 68-like n=1 Tax=Scleropages formosus TaxID=113540 RepID=UPI000878ADC5|nr:coiled-coil domain-containing protein 68 [Scleropages formosus]
MWRKLPVGSQGSTEDNQDNVHFSRVSYIKEETEYVRKICSELEKMKKRTRGSEEAPAETKGRGPSVGTRQLRGRTSPHPRHRRVLEELNAKESQLSGILAENRELRLKLEALREAGAETLRNASARLFQRYRKQMQEEKEAYGELKRTLQTRITEQEDKLSTRLKRLKSLERKLQDKQHEVREMETRIERMREERIALTARKNLIEHKTMCKLSKVHKPRLEAESLRSHKVEICTLGEKICHLDDVILSQSNKIRCYLQQIKELNVDLSAQESAVESLTEKLHAAQAQNEELKYLLEFWSSQTPEEPAGTAAKRDYGCRQEVHF